MPSGSAVAVAEGQAASQQGDAKRSAFSMLERARSLKDPQVRTRGKFAPESGEITLRASLRSEGRTALGQKVKVPEAAGVRPEGEDAPVGERKECRRL